jgi:hypothetical protein
MSPIRARELSQFIFWLCCRALLSVDVPQPCQLGSASLTTDRITVHTHKTLGVDTTSCCPHAAGHRNRSTKPSRRRWTDHIQVRSHLCFASCRGSNVCEMEGREEREREMSVSPFLHPLLPFVAQRICVVCQKLSICIYWGRQRGRCELMV